MSDAITRHRQMRELSLDELAHTVGSRGHPITPDRLGRMEHRQRPITVDDLMLLAYALGTTSAVLLAHVPIDQPGSDGPLGTGLPANVGPLELRAWIEGRTGLDATSRIRWTRQRITELLVRQMHHDDQLRAAREEFDALGKLAQQEADAPPVRQLVDLIGHHEHELIQTELVVFGPS